MSLSKIAKSGVPPRAVIVRRPSPYEQLLARHGTAGQARFFLESRGRTLGTLEGEHQALEKALFTVLDAIPTGWRRARIERRDLASFTFEPSDVVVAVGQDGLVANVARFVQGQPVIGVNPLPDRFPGVLVPHPPKDAKLLLRDAARGAAPISPRTMVQVALDDGQHLRALNEVFLGHSSHQSARYRLTVGASSERQSSSGLIVSTGTGATGWAASILKARGRPLALPAPGDRRLAWFVREAWPGGGLGADLIEGVLDQGAVEVVSEFETGGVIFGDGIEADHLAFGWGQTARISVAADPLNWVG
ncbi:MAG: NAD(+)/NADH kinase [Myxococcales bacterium]|nr:NAD(+)/NADH kinase [Myxococcales bacterium]MCB9525721.1 NAD(+)/NADH kinase [Myxococcales bacterium]